MIYNHIRRPGPKSHECQLLSLFPARSRSLALPFVSLWLVRLSLPVSLVIELRAQPGTESYQTRRYWQLCSKTTNTSSCWVFFFSPFDLDNETAHKVAHVSLLYRHPSSPYAEKKKNIYPAWTHLRAFDLQGNPGLLRPHPLKSRAGRRGSSGLPEQRADQTSVHSVRQGAEKMQQCRGSRCSVGG